MDQIILKRYAHLLVDYCLELKAGDKLFVSTTTLAEPLVREVYRAATVRGALVHIAMDFQGQERILMEMAPEALLGTVSPVKKILYESFDACLHIRAPFNYAETQWEEEDRLKLRRQALAPIQSLYATRTADGSLRRSLCQYPTNAAAQMAGMPLEAYESFVYQACKLLEPDPIAAWLEVGARQQQITELLNSTKKVQYVGPNCDISFSCEGRIWINSDGRTNMPSGEVYTAPVDDSTNGWITFSYPSIYQGQEVEKVTLYVKDGWIEKWEAEKGKGFLDEVFKIEGARRFGEAAIGTNYSINRITKNILFDEKIGGSVHMAIGQAYIQNNGRNKSPIHWDMITDMRNGGRIYADDRLIYENGQFL